MALTFAQTQEVKRDILLYFQKDAQPSPMYDIFRQRGYSVRDVRSVFMSLKALGYIVRTNPYSKASSSFCISRTGRELLLREFGIQLGHPDGELAICDDQV